jgi:S-formylglutathione hydrolase FrmB
MRLRLRRLRDSLTDDRIGYDPGYDFISTFMSEHLAWHAESLQEMRT